MACNCLTLVRQELQTKYKDPDLRVQVSFSLTCTYPMITFEYRKLKKDGTFRKSLSSGTMIPTYCPFCGELYEDAP